MKLLVENAGSIYRFLDIHMQKDGSVYVSLDRKPRDPANRLSRKQGETYFTAVAPPNGSRKLSYHTTGRVNYHGLVSAPRGFFEPLVDITGPNSVLLISVPSCSLLDKYEYPIDAIQDCRIFINQMERFAVAVTFAPPGFPNQPGVRYDFSSFVLLVHPVAIDIAPPSPKHFVYGAPPSLFENQRIGKHEAELAYVQGEGGSHIIVSGPNAQGHYTMYFSAVMRAAPNVKVELTDPKLKFELIDNSQPHKLTFRIRGKADLIREPDLRSYIRSIELDAEL